MTTPAGYCLARIAGAANGLRFPRRIVEVAQGRYWITDMGSWEPNRGRLLELALRPDAASAERVTIKVLADKLDRPHGLILGPDGRVYVGEAGRLWRTPVAAAVAPQTVIDGLPADGAHPLKEFVFGSGGRLFVNVGSSSDACRADDGRSPQPCPDGEGARPRAAVYLAQLGGPDLTLQSLRPWATGLRNSMALAFVHGPDVLLQGENSIDYADLTQPPEELNLLRDGQHYGWPYCVGARQPARGYEGRFDCARTEPPAMLWPAHVAPLQMVAVPRATLAAGAASSVMGGAGAASGGHPANAAAQQAASGAVPAAQGNPFAGQLLVVWHGHRPAGHRVVGFALDAKGRPRGAAIPWITGWQARPGGRPQGAPTGLLLDSAGRLLVVEDRNRSVLMLMKEEARGPAETALVPARSPPAAPASAAGNAAGAATAPPVAR